MSRKQKKLFIRILAATGLFVIALLLPLGSWSWYIELILYLVPYLVIGYPVLKKATINIMSGQIFDENFLMAIATLGALAIGEYPEAVFVLLFYEVGELFESLAVGKSRRSITSLMDLRPEVATVVRGGVECEVSPEEVSVGETLLIRPGERVPLDGTVTYGSSSINTVALTGESAPRDVMAGDTVLSGCINGQSPLHVCVTKRYEESTASRILALVEESTANKARSEAFITRFAKYYTPFVVFAAAAVAVIPSLFDGNWAQWIYRALSFLVISCPCALVISVPLSYFAGIGAASKNGILIKGSQYLERLASCRTAVFDKTGTLTEGTFRVKAIRPRKATEEELLRLAASAEAYSNHPIALSVKAAYGEREVILPTAVEEKAGLGIKAEIEEKCYYVGNARLMAEVGIICPAVSEIGTVLHLSEEERYLGCLVIADTVKEGSKDALLALKRDGVRKTVMLTGDTSAVAEAVAGDLPIDTVISELLPDGKVAEVERLLKEDARGGLMFVGDGINDAPVLARADVGVAMGALGSDAAIEAADVVIMDDDLRRLGKAVAIARKTNGIVLQNIMFSLAVKGLVLLLSAFGVCGMWVAVFADVGVMVLAVLNALRALK